MKFKVTLLTNSEYCFLKGDRDPDCVFTVEIEALTKHGACEKAIHYHHGTVYTIEEIR